MTRQFRSDVLRQANSGYVLRSLRELASRKPTDWLASDHIAKTGQLLRTDGHPQRSWPQILTLPPEELVEAVAVSIPHHCIDGWGFLSRALSALASGDFHTSRHLAYYAQLRAALCTLGCFGVGVFNGVNFVVDDAGQIICLDARGVAPPSKDHKGFGTHTIVWKALEGWGSDNRLAALLLDKLHVQGTALSECISSVWPGANFATSASDLLAAWGLDLSRGEKEHVFRNVSSYAPQALNPLTVPISKIISFIEEFWRLFEPSGGTNIDLLDRHILRMLLRKTHRLLHQNIKYRSGPIFNRYEELPYRVQNMASKKFLIGEESPETPSILTYAQATIKIASPIEMISRAALLLRTASSVFSNSCVEAGINHENGELRPWFAEFGLNRGLWRIDQEPEDYVELWYDVQPALEDLVEAATNNPANLYDWTDSGLTGLPLLQQAERVGLWSVTI